MEQQQLNDEINPLHQQDLIEEEVIQSGIQRTQFKALKCQKDLYKHFYTSFPPFRHYFANATSRICLHWQKPQLYLHSCLYDRQRLNLQRQSMYYRGAVDEYINDDFLKPFFNQAELQKGFVHRKRNKSLIVEKILYYAHQDIIKAIQLPQLENNNCLQIYQSSIEPIEIVRFQKEGHILEINQLKNHLFNTLAQGTVLIIRFARNFAIFAVNQRKMLHSFSSHHELLQVNTSIYAKNSIQTMQYDRKNSFIHTFDFNSKKGFDATSKTTTNVEYLVNSYFKLNKNQLFLSKYESLSILDERISKQCKLYSVKNLSKERIFNSIPLKGLYHYSPLILCCQSRHISIFDMRKLVQPIRRIPHHCQESPPQIMSFYDGSLTSQLAKPILTCNSPYKLGSSLFTTIDMNSLEIICNRENQYSISDEFRANAGFKLLYDQGKHCGSTSQQHFFNQSVSIWNENSERCLVFEIDNVGNVNSEIFCFNEFKQSFERSYCKFERQLEEKIMNPISQNLTQTWLQSNLVDKFLKFQNVYEQIEGEIVPSESNLKVKKKTSKKKKKNASFNSKKKIKEVKQSLTSIQAQDFLDGQYENSQECQESFSKRKLNFSDLKQFYKTLQAKASEQKTLEIVKPTQIDFSMSTQANSQGLSFSQSFEDSGIKTLSFHNKKVMNFSILEKLKNQWDN